MEEVGGDHVGDEGRGLFLKHHCNNVVSYVTLPLQLEDKHSGDGGEKNTPTSRRGAFKHGRTNVGMYLLCVSLGEGQFRGHVEHDLLLSVDRVDGLRSRLTMRHVQTPTEAAQRVKVKKSYFSP